MEPVIRLAVLKDVPGILGLEAEFPTDRISPKSLLRLLRSGSAYIWVATGSAAPCGVIAALVVLTRRNSRIARIYSLAVHPRARRQRLGIALVEHAQRWARSGGYRQMSLEVRADNIAALSLYTNLGYRISARLPVYYADGSNALRFIRDL